MAYRILIIDDDTELLKMLKTYFEIKKYEIIMAENGLEGLDRIKLQPDIILLDVNMQGIDGIEVCKRIRDKVACPILFLTARVEEQDVVNGISSRGDDYILKPFSLRELDARIMAHLKREMRRKEKTECCFQGELSIDYQAKTVQIHTDYLELTKLEYGIIEFLTMNPGMVFEKFFYIWWPPYFAVSFFRQLLPELPNGHRCISGGIMWMKKHILKQWKIWQLPATSLQL